MAAPVSVLPTLSALAFLEWEREQEGRYEWLDGEVFAMSGGTLRHNALGAAVVGELRLALKGRPCRVLSSDQKIAARPNKHFVYADTSVVCGDRVLAEGTTDVLANPEIVVEVLSTTTESYDRGLKWESYQRIASLRDYVLVSQARVRVEHFSRDAAEPDMWRYRELGRGDVLMFANGATVAVDSLFEGVFELDGE